MALDYVMNNSLDNKFVIFSDSFFVLKYLNDTSSQSSKIQNLIEKHHELSIKTVEESVHAFFPLHVYTVARISNVVVVMVPKL